MIGIDSIKISPHNAARLRRIDEFKGLWKGLEHYTTGLQLLGDVASHSIQVQKVLTPLQNKEVTTELIQLLHGIQIGKQGLSAYKTDNYQLPIMCDDAPAGFLDTAPPAQVPALMSKLVEWLNDSLPRTDTHPLITIAVFSAVFLQISPFEKGNIRTMRFLNLLLLMKAGYNYAPYVPLDKIMSARGQDMFKALQHNQNSLEQGNPDWDEWLGFFFDLLGEQTHILEQRLDQKDKDLSSIPTLSARIMRLFESHKRLQMKDIVRLTKGRRSTLKLRLGELVKQGYLRRYGQARSTWYSQV